MIYFLKVYLCSKSFLGLKKMESTNNYKPHMFKLFLLLFIGWGGFIGWGSIDFFKNQDVVLLSKSEIDSTLRKEVDFSSRETAIPVNTSVSIMGYRQLTYEEKLGMEKKLNVLAVEKYDLKEMSGAALYHALLEKGAVLDDDIKQRILNEKFTEKDWEYILSYMAQLSTEEENFKIEMASSSNFSELKKRVEARAEKTGLFYGDMMLGQSGMYKDAAVADVLALLREGAILPDNAMEYMVNQDNIDLAVALNKEGININTDYIDEFRSMNLFEMHADKLAINPFSASIDHKLQELDKLSSLGVPIKLNDGTRDALDIVLFAAVKHDKAEAAKLLQYALKVNQMGIPVEQAMLSF